MAVKLNNQASLQQKTEDLLNNPMELAPYDPDGTVAKLANDLQNYKKFSYDFNADPLYQNYKDQYMQGGRMAMQDTMANAAALSGGYGNSYAATVGNQAYQQYLTQLNNVIPELYQAAYTRYSDDRNNARVNYEMMKGLADDAYNRSKDAANLWQTNLSNMYGMYNDLRGFDENKRQFNEGLTEDKRQFDEGLTERQNDRNEDARQFNEGLTEDKRQFDANLTERQNDRKEDARQFNESNQRAKDELEIKRQYK